MSQSWALPVLTMTPFTCCTSRPHCTTLSEHTASSAAPLRYTAHLPAGIALLSGMAAGAAGAAGAAAAAACIRRAGFV